MTQQLYYQDVADMTPLDRLEAFNTQLAIQAADAPLRKLSGQILKGCTNVPKYGPVKIARWIRRNIDYLQEAPFIEVLQGPYTTLETGVGDCDDLAGLWVALTRAAGLETYVVGVAEVNNPASPYHAIGYDAGTRRHFDPTNDTRYGGGIGGDVSFTPLAPCARVFYAPEPSRARFYWSPTTASPYRAATRQSILTASVDADAYQTMARPQIVRQGTYGSPTMRHNPAFGMQPRSMRGAGDVFKDAIGKLDGGGGSGSGGDLSVIGQRREGGRRMDDETRSRLIGMGLDAGEGVLGQLLGRADRGGPMEPPTPVAIQQSRPSMTPYLVVGGLLLAGLGIYAVAAK